MSNNKLYIVDTETMEYLCIAKAFGIEWSSGNIDLYQDFISSRFISEHGPLNLIIGHECDDKFYEKWISNPAMTNYNKENKWT